MLQLCDGSPYRISKMVNIDGVEYPSRVASAGYTNVYNLTGMPALTLPMGFDDDGMPMGLQIAAAHFREEVVYCVAAAFEDAAGWCHRHPAL